MTALALRAKKAGIEPRKQPRQGRSRATVEAILEAATQLLGQAGLDGFNTNLVADRAGVSIGSLYQYFPNKDAIMAALIERQHAAQLRNLDQALGALDGLSLDQTVRVLVRAAMRHHHDNALLASAIDHEEARLPIPDLLDHVQDLAGARLAQVLEHYRDELPELDVSAALRTLPPLLRAVVDRWANLTPPDLRRAEEQAIFAVLGYLRQAGAR